MLKTSFQHDLNLEELGKKIVETSFGVLADI